MPPEQLARQRIDQQLLAAGWIVQNHADLNLSAGRGIAVREFPLKTGVADYLLYADGKAIGVIEAKPVGHSLTGVETQSKKYRDGLPQGLPHFHLPLPFAYESTGTETRFTNMQETDACSRVVFSFHRPEELVRLATLDAQVRTLLRQMPALDPRGMWSAQVQAVQNLEKSLALNKPRALIQMATGSGKTFTAVNFCYRLIKHARAKRILFLVDRNNLGRQTLNEFQQFVSPVNGYKFTDEYGIQHLKGNSLDPAAKVCIATIQRVYATLKGEEYAEENEEGSLFETETPLLKEPLPVVYNAQFPLETFDFIVIDECHRSIYNIWRQVLDYFDAFLIGLTATPTAQTIGFFNGNLVQEYTHERAIVDGVNVGFDVFRIETEVTAKGAKLKKEPGTFVPHRDRRTKQKKFKELDDDLTYTAGQLDRDVVNENQIRLVVQTFRDKLPEIFPGRTEVPKTLVFAKTDLHAEDVVRILREEFGKGNDFVQKITSKSTGKKPEELLAEFRNSYNPRIAVTVDMIATGTDVKPLECLVFLRNIRSLAYFEQMKGRGCRVINPDALMSVTPDAKHKTHFVIVDAVGVCEEEKSTTKPLDRQPSVPLDKLLKLVAAGAATPEIVSTLAARLARLELQADDEQQAAIAAAAGGMTLTTLAGNLLQSIDADEVVAEASRRFLASSSPCDLNFFDPAAPIAELSGNLPHWRQAGVSYFVTFRLADSIPASQLQLWQRERDDWLARHPEPHSPAQQQEYAERFVERFHRWLDQGHGACVLKRPEIRQIVIDALQHFDGDRYGLLGWVVMPNHVHVVVAPYGEHELSDILHSWKSFTAKAINRLLGQRVTLWQKESFDHIVRSPESLERILAYITANPRGLPDGTFSLSEGMLTRRDAASTLTEAQLNQVEQQRMTAALKPFHNPKLRERVLGTKQALEQVIDQTTPDKLLQAGFSAAAQEKARSLISSFRQFIEDHKDEIEALKILYSQPYKAGLRFWQVKALAKALQQPPHTLQPELLWKAYELVEPERVRGHGGKQLVDVIALVRHALDPASPLAPVGQTVQERFGQWLADQSAAGVAFTPEQQKWLEAIRDHIATSLAIEQDDLDEVPFNQIGGLGRAYELFGEQLAALLDELNARLAA